MDLTGWLPLLFIPAVVIVLGVHELGHLLAAKALGVRPLEFGLGIPPRALTIHTGSMTVQCDETAHASAAVLQPGSRLWMNVRRTPTGDLIACSVGARRVKPQCPEAGETTITGKLRSTDAETLTIAPMQWSLGIIPIGAFVRVAEGNGGPEALESASAKAQCAILIAGIVANLILPVFALSAASVTATVNTGVHVAQPTPGSAAWDAGIREGDRIIKVDGRQQGSLEELRQATAESRTAPVTVTIRTPSGDQDIIVERTHQGQALGINAAPIWQSDRPVDQIKKVPVAAAHNTVHMYRIIGEEINSWMKTENSPELVSPIGAARETGNVVEQGRVTGWLIVVALFSANVGLANLLPIMPLDGGRLAMVGIKASFGGRPLNRKIEAMITYTGLAAIISVTMSLIIKDITVMLSG